MTYERGQKIMRATWQGAAMTKPGSLLFSRFFVYFFINGKSKSPHGSSDINKPIADTAKGNGDIVFRVTTGLTVNQ